MGDNDLLMSILMTLQYLEQQRDYSTDALKAKSLVTEAFATRDAFEFCIGALKSTLEAYGIEQDLVENFVI